MKETYLITTAIDYPNGKPHIGHAYEKIIADVLARWQRLCGKKVFFLTGTDENSQNILRKAKEANKDPNAFVEENVALFKEMCQLLSITYDGFIRTNSKKHIRTAQKIFEQVFKKGEIYKQQYTGLYCQGCEKFVTEKDLQNGQCPDHKTTPEKISEENYFFKLSQYQTKIKEHIKNNPQFILPTEKRNEILNRLEEPLKDLSVSRPNKNWGIPVPFDKTQSIYVWFDALLNYITGIDYPNKKYQKFWPANVQIIGRDITWFHTVIWPAILLANEIPLPKTVHSHGFLTAEGQKMSKTVGNLIEPKSIIEKYSADALRYYLLREVPAGQDGDFSEKALIQRNNSDLADELGNLVNRVTVLVKKNFEGKIPKPTKFTDLEKELIKSSEIFKRMNEQIQQYQWHHAVETLWNFIHQCNKYTNTTEPWKTNDKDRLATILYTLIECLRIISILAQPFIPTTAEKIAKQIGIKLKGKPNFKKKTTGIISNPEIIVKKFEHEEPDPFSLLNLKIAEVKTVKDHPNADKLYVLQVSTGEEELTVCAGLKQYYQPEELIGKKAVLVANLKPAELRGVLSQGMLLAAEKEKLRILEATNANPGDTVTIEGILPGKKQITIEEFKKIKITTSKKRAVYNGKNLRTKNGEITVDIEDNANVR